MTTLNCKRCGKPFVSHTSRHKFCSSTCEQRFNALKYYHLHKHEKNYREPRNAYFKKYYHTNKKYFQKYYDDHKEHLKELMRQVSRRRYWEKKNEKINP